jgi:hypothetical protein
VLPPVAHALNLDFNAAIAKKLTSPVCFSLAQPWKGLWKGWAAEKKEHASR